MLNYGKYFHSMILIVSLYIELRHIIIVYPLAPYITCCDTRHRCVMPWQGEWKTRVDISPREIVRMAMNLRVYLQE